MSWHLSDLLEDSDLEAYEQDVLTRFGTDTWQARRTKALEDWLFPILRGRGFDPYALRTRYEPEKVYGFTANTYSDVTSKAQDGSADDLDLAGVFATPANDALYIGSTRPFRGLFLRLLDAVSSAAGTMSVAYWSGTWETLAINDRTKANNKAFGQGGSVTWTLPVDWATRKVNDSDQLYWVKVTTSATPTSATASQIGTIRASCLRAPVTFRTLQLIFQEAPTSADGPWATKAEFYKDEADLALQRALAIVGGEFDTDASDLVSQAETEQTPETAGGHAHAWERA